MSQATTQYHSLDTPEKQLLRQKIAEILTPELKRQCPGLVITVHSLDEHNIIMNALTEVSDRKLRERALAGKRRSNHVQPLTLNVINPTEINV